MMLKKFCGFIFMLVLGILIGFSANSFSSSSSSSKLTEVRGGSYAFINPLLECEIGGDKVEFQELKPFKNKVTDLIKQLTDSGNAKYVAVYFRDLNNGPWFGINEKDLFSPGSLLKVPTMIAAFRQEEQSPGFFKKTIKYTQSSEFQKEFYQQIKPSENLKIGQAYSLEELVRRMIVYSDNEALALVSGAMDENLFSMVHNDLGVVFPIDGTPENYITVKNYASFFRILYNASYLSRDNSEKALEFLSESDFQNGLAAGIPRNIKLAHKFGERGGFNIDEQIHDCGIIYYPKHPYLLCVMNRGKDIDTLSKNIAKISKLIYQEVDSQSQ